MRYPAYIQDTDLQKEPEEVIRKKVEALLAAMTIEEKADLCHGDNNPSVPGQVGNGGYLRGVPRLGVPELRMYDGPAGATFACETTGLPAEELLAATWDPEMARTFGRVTGSENHMDGGNVQLGAEVDLVRTTHFNRTRDMLGEDPFLAGEMGASLVQGIQEEHVMATLKHFAGYVVSANPANPSNTVIDEQTMHELYLAPFEKCLREGKAASVMTAYSRINGTYASSSTPLLQDVLRSQWNSDAFVMCDWGANHGFTLDKGMEMEMPLGSYNSTKRILRFLREGKCSQEDLDTAVRHILTAMGRAGYLSLVMLNDEGRVQEEKCRTEPIRIPVTYEDRAGLRRTNALLAEKIAEEGTVLLKNDGVLPIPTGKAPAGEKKQAEDKATTGAADLRKEHTKDMDGGDILLVGTGAAYPICGYGQERSYGTLCYQTSPYEEIVRIYGKERVELEIGQDLVGETIPEQYLFVAEENFPQEPAGGRHGVSRYYGISKEDGYRPPLMSMGGEGQELIITQPSGQEDDEALHFAPAELFQPSSDAIDMAGHVTGTPAGTDSVISFMTGSRNYKNAADETVGRAFTRGSAYTWKGYLEAPENGIYQLNLHAIGGVVVWKMMLEDGKYTDIGTVKMREGTQWPWGNLVSTPTGMEVCCTRVKLEKGHKYPFVVYGKALMEEKDLQIELAWVTPSARKEQQEAAIRKASGAAHTILFIQKGFTVQNGAADGSLSFAEDCDLTLDPEQKDLLLALSRAAHAHGGDLTVAAYNGSAFAMADWIDQVDALLYLWMPGQGGARALAKLICGEAVPSGKLPQSFPRDNTDTPVSTSGEMLKERWYGLPEGKTYQNIHASEGIYTGYRWYDHENRKPLFPFGYGLSYTTFAYRDLRVHTCRQDRTDLQKKAEALTVEFDVTNTGTCSADEIAQVYIGRGEVPSCVMAAEKTLCGFARIKALSPGETRHVSITIPQRALQYWDVKAPLQARQDGTKDKWRTAGGRRTIQVGASCEDIRLKEDIVIAGD